jgi:hypothetical protein
MPRHKDPDNVRCVQISITVRPKDIYAWRAEGNRLGCSLSKVIWLRALAGKPLPSEGHLAVAAALGRIGNNLNQAVRRLNLEGACSSAMAVEETLRAVAEIQEQLRAL